MSVHYIGHPLTRGRGEIALDYKVKDQHLKGTNHIVTQDLTLGDKVAGEGKVNLPIKLGVSILTDKEGRITLDVPVEGRLDDPKFGVGDAIGGVLSGLIKSPFRLLGKIGGGKEGEDLGTVEFPAGSAVLEPASAERLRTLANALKERPELRIVVAGAWDEDADGTALREAKAPIPEGGLATLGQKRADAVRKALVDAGPRRVPRRADGAARRHRLHRGASPRDARNGRCDRGGGASQFLGAPPNAPELTPSKHETPRRGSSD